MSRRRKWILATVATALYALQAPLCVFACLENPAGASQSAESPCHEEGPVAATGEVPASHAECGCEPSLEALKYANPSPSEPRLVVFRSHPRRDAAVLDRPWPSTLPDAAQLPSPDIILLESTLLL